MTNTTELTLFFDGRCPFCSTEMQRLSRWDKAGRLGFSDIARPGFDPASLGVDMAALQRELHSQTATGQVLVGIDSMVAAYTLAGRSWLVLPLRVPALRPPLAYLYRLFARNRYRISRWLGYQISPQCSDGICPVDGPFLKQSPPGRTKVTMHAQNLRKWIVRWLYATVLTHLLVGILLPWIADAPLFDTYHRGIEAAFWSGSAPAAARAQQVWWMALFGPTAQGLAIWMAALVRIGDRQRSVTAWSWLIVGILVWAPQDMLISLRADCWPHVWIDCLAVAALLPPLAWLWQHDRRQQTITDIVPEVSA